MSGRPSIFGLLFPAALILSVAWPVAAWPQDTEPASETETQPLEFRRVYVPENRLEDIPREHERLLPMPAQEFERLVAELQPPAVSEGLSVGLLSASYQAKLEGDRLVDGQATFEIFHSGEEGVLLPLTPFGLAISQADWLSEKPQPAVIGMAADGRVNVLVPRQGRLRLGWSLAGERSEDGTVEFQLAIPTCGVARLALDLPAGVTPLIKEAIVTKLKSADGRTQWQIELKSQERILLRIVPDEQLEPGPQRTRLRQSLVYDFSLRGVEVSAEMQLDAYGEPLQQISLELGPEMQLVAAEYGAMSVPRTTTSAEGKNKPSHVVLQLPEAIQGTGRVLRLTCWIPLVLDRPWKLPGIQVEKVFWQEGTASLLIPSPLALGQMNVADGRQSKTGSLSGSRSGQRMEIQYFAPNGSVEVVLTRPKTPIDVAQGVAVELANQQMSAEVIAALKLTEGNRFELAATIGRQWMIDTVETVPADILDDWTTQSGRANRTLRLRLSKPLSPSRPVRLLVHARWLNAPLTEGLTAKDLTPLTFRDSRDSRQLIWVRAGETYQLKIVEDSPESRVDPQTLGADELALFSEPPRSPLFTTSQGDADWQVFPEPQKPVYTATIRVEAGVSKNTLQESYKFDCVPKGARVQHLVVQFSQAREEPLRWTLGNNSEELLAASRQAPEGSSPADGEVWQIELTPPRSVPFTIRASRSADLQGPQPVSLASLSGADEQQGTVVVSSTGDTGIQIDNHQLQPIATEPQPDDRVTPIRASFRYVPTRDALPSAEAALTVACQSEERSPASCWAWSCRLESWLKPDGSGLHLAAYHLESWGRQEVRIRLPASSSLDAVCGVWVDRARTTWRPSPEDAGAVLVALPKGRRYPAVAIQYESTGPELGWVDSVEAAFPQLDIPVLARRWTVWLPPGYAWRKPNPRWLVEARPATSWTKRMFGPLGRPAGEPPFDPVDLKDLAHWLAPAKAAAATEGPVDSQGGEQLGPWPQTQAGELLPGDTRGWTAHNLEIPLDEPAVLRVVHRDTLQAIGLAVLFGVLAIAWWFAVDRPVVLVMLFATFGTVALLLPETFAGLASFAVLGVLVCLGYRLIRRRQELPPVLEGEHRDQSSLVRAAVQTGLLMLTVVLTLAMCVSASGQPPQESQSGPKPRDYNVFIPVDEADQPTGDVVQVPEPLYNELYRQAASRNAGPQGWLLLGAAYRGTLNWQPGGERLALDRLSATFDIQVLGKCRSVAIPLGGEAVTLAAEGALLDGRPVQPRWLEQKGLLAFDIDDDQAKHQIEIPLRPTVQTDGALAGFDVRIPSWAGARLELAVPSDAPEVNVLSSAGPVIRETDPDRVVAQLGPINRLTVHWPEQGGRTSGGPTVEVEEMLWLKVRDGSVVLDARFRFTPTQGHLSQLELVADSRLRLLPQETPNPAIASVETLPTQPQTIRFELAQPTTEPIVLAASFLLRESSGVGNLRLPLLAPQGARSTKRWLALWTDPSLDILKEEVPEPFAQLAAGDFEKAWGPTEIHPQESYIVPPGETTWSINTRPRGPRTTADEALTLSFGEDQVQVDYSAKLVTSDGYVFRYRLSVPSGLDVESISLQADSAEQVTRWAQAADKTVTVFLSGPVGGDQVLTLRGSQAIGKSGQTRLPMVHLEGMESEKGTVTLLRKPAVALNVVRAEGLTDAANPGAEPGPDDAVQFVRSMQYEDAESVDAVVKVEANRPQIDAKQITRVRFDGESWEAEVELDLDVRQGLLDELRLSVPEEFAGPYQLTPPAPVERTDRSGSNELVIHPPATAGGDYRLTIRSPLKFGLGDRIRVPDVVPQGVELTDRLLVLPTQLELAPAEWETKGLAEVSLPAHVDSTPIAPESFITFRVEQPQYEAILRPAQGVAQVHMADVRLAWQADGDCFGAATFDLEPAGLSECLLRLPDGCHLIGVSVGDVPAAATPTDAGLWRVPLGPPGYPRAVDVLFAGRVPVAEPGQPFELQAPQIEGLTVHRTLWTVSSPFCYRVGPPAGLGQATSLEQTRLRLEQVRQMILRSAEITSEEKDQADPWYRLWAKRFVNLRNKLESQWQEAGRGASAMENWTTLVSTDKLPPPAATLIESPPAAGTAQTDNPWLDGNDATWLGAWQTRPAPLRCITDGNATSLAVSVARRQRDDSQHWLAAAVLVALAIFAVAALRTGLADAAYSRWPQLAGVALGLAWWLLLWPSVLGLVIVAASLIASVRPGWKRRRTSGSVIVPISTVHR